MKVHFGSWTKFDLQFDCRKLYQVTWDIDEALRRGATEIAIEEKRGRKREIYYAEGANCDRNFAKFAFAVKWGRKNIRVESP